MASLIAGLVDVFAAAPLEGNPLAVVEGADGLDDRTLRRIAGEFNQAETTFLLPSARADWRLRSFTAAGAEVFGAGHNALGAWLWLGYEGRLGALAEPATFRQEIGSEILPVVLERRVDRLHGRMRQAPLRLQAPLAQVGPLARALGLDPARILPHPAPRAADTGAAHLMVRLADRVAVDAARPDPTALLAVLGPAGAEGCYVYAFDERAPDRAYSRFFNPTVGLVEDSATGTAAGPLAGYLGKAGLLPAGRLTVEQGRVLGRPSFLEVGLMPEPELSGSGVVVLSGRLEI